MLSQLGRRGLLLLLLILLIVDGSASPVFAINFNAYWRYRQRGGTDTETQSEFEQRYLFGVGPAVTYQPTHAISGSANVGYTHTQADRGGERGTVGVDRLTPTAQLNLLNDIFLTQLSANSTTIKSDSGRERSDTTWDTTLASRWDIPLFPKLNLNYGERTENDDTARLFGFAGRRIKNTTMSVSWDLILADLDYQYTILNTEDPESRSQVDIDSHFVRIETGGNFWENRFRFNLAQQFRYVTQDISVEGESTNFALNGQISSAVTDPDDPDLQDPSPVNPWTDQKLGLAINSQLGDGELEATALVVPSDQRVHLVVNFDTRQQIDIIRLTLEPLSTLTEAQASLFQWSLFLRDPSGTGWESMPEVADILFTYDATQKRFELTIDRIEEEFMLVAINPTTVSLEFTELEAFTVLTEDQMDSHTTSSGYLTNLSTGYKITRTLLASANLVLEHNKNDLADSSIERDKRGINATLRWIPVSYVVPSLSYSEFRDEETGDPTDLSRTYSLTVPTQVLPTMNITPAVTINERFSDDQKTSLVKRYSLTTRAQIYPDLNGSWSLSYTDSERLVDEGLYTTSTSFASRLDLKAQLNRKLFADLLTNYRRGKNQTASTQNSDVTLSLLYRASDLLALRGDYTTYFGDRASVDKMNLGLFLVLLRTNKTRLELNVTHSQADEKSEFIGLDGSWAINKNFSLQTRCNYRITEETNIYDFFVYLTMRL